MTVLITGGAGFVGSSLAIYLKNKYPLYTIIALDNLKRRGSEINLTELKAHGITFIHGDIRNREDFDQLDGFDIMIEASAEPSVLAGLDSSPDSVINNNLLGAINCFNSCTRHKANLIFLSTSRVYPIAKIENAVYTESDTRFSFAEHQSEAGISALGISEQLSLEGARSFYGSTKLTGELLIREYEEFYGLRSAITRFGVVAGARQMGKTDQGIATLWMAKHFWNQSLKYIGYGGMGKQVRDILHISDLATLIDVQIHSIDKFCGKVYNAGGGIANSLSLQEMTKICQDISGNKIPIDSIPVTRPADLKAYITDNSKIQNEIGWSPQKNTEYIFNDIFIWLKENEKELQDILK